VRFPCWERTEDDEGISEMDKVATFLGRKLPVVVDGQLTSMFSSRLLMRGGSRRAVQSPGDP
jgi:hypothetical protein